MFEKWVEPDEVLEDEARDVDSSFEALGHGVGLPGRTEFYLRLEYEECHGGSNYEEYGLCPKYRKCRLYQINLEDKE